MIKTENQKIYENALMVLSSLKSEITESFLKTLPSVKSLKENDLDPEYLPIIKLLKTMHLENTPFPEILEIIINTSNRRTWRQPYNVGDFGVKFHHNTGWFPIADANGPLVYSEGLVEIMLLNSNTKYPNHSHSPEELYIILYGKVLWESEQEAGPVWKRPGEIIHHLPNCKHSITSGDEPVLILAFWRGGGFEKPIIG